MLRQVNLEDYEFIPFSSIFSKAERAPLVFTVPIISCTLVAVLAGILKTKELGQYINREEAWSMEKASHKGC